MKIHQFRCWPSGSSAQASAYNNISPDNLFSYKNILAQGTNGTNSTYSQIVQLGIQGAPGTRFWLNDSRLSNNADAMQGIVLNWTGIFEIDLSDFGGEINSIIFDPASRNLYEGDNASNYKIVIDILYKGGNN